MLTFFLLSCRVSAISFLYYYTRISFHTFVSNNCRDMAKLYINKDIQPEADKMKYWLSGDDCISFADIQGFIDWIPADDNRIDIELHSCGGNCVEGYAI